MEPKITASNVDEFLTSYIDNQGLESDSRKQIEQLIASDETVSRKYRAEKLTKELFASRLKQEELSPQTYNRISASIDNLIQQAVQSKQSEQQTFAQHLKNFFIEPLRLGRLIVPRYAFAAVVLLIIVGVGILLNSRNSQAINPFYANGTESSVIVQAVDNFHKILKGEIKPTVKSSNAQELKNYVATKSNFDAYVPHIENYELVGVVTTEYKGKQLAHFVYTSGDELIYIYETALDSECRKKLDVPNEMHNEVISKKYYMCDHVDDHDCTFTMWYKNNVLCASVSNMPKQKMVTTFASFNK